MSEAEIEETMQFYIALISACLEDGDEIAPDDVRQLLILSGQETGSLLLECFRKAGFKGYADAYERAAAAIDDGISGAVEEKVTAAISSADEDEPYTKHLIDLARFLRIPISRVLELHPLEIAYWQEEFRRRPPFMEAVMLARIFAAVVSMGGKVKSPDELAPWAYSYEMQDWITGENEVKEREQDKAMLAEIWEEQKKKRKKETEDG